MDQRELKRHNSRFVGNYYFTGLLYSFYEVDKKCKVDIEKPVPGGHFKPIAVFKQKSCSH